MSPLTVEVKRLHTPCKICKMFIMLPSKRDHIKHVNLFEFEDQGKVNIFILLENM